MRISHYLIKEKSGVYYFRLKIPAALRITLGRCVIKKSLLTHDRNQAQKMALGLAFGYSKLLHNSAWGGGMGSKEEKEILEAFGLGDHSTLGRRPMDFEISLHANGRVKSLKTDGSEADNIAANKAVAVIMAANATNTDKKMPKMPLKVFGEQWLFRLDASSPKAKTKAAKQRAVLGFIGWKGGETQIAALTPGCFADYAVFLRTEAGGALSLSYAKDQLMYLAMMMQSAIREGFYMGENPAKGLITYNKKQKDLQTNKTGWQPFNANQIGQIFKPENFAAVGQEHTRWCLILALYTGARISELAQLALADIEQDSAGRWVIRIDTIEKDQSLKTADSRRTVPIHKDLIKLGLIKRVERLAEAGETMLFPKLKSGVNGYGGAVSHGISRYLEKLQIKPRGGGKLGAHSFRVGLIQVLDDAAELVTDGECRLYVGHTIAADAHSGYGSKGRAVSAREHVKKQHNVFNVLKALPPKYWALDLAGLKENLQ